MPFIGAIEGTGAWAAVSGFLHRAASHCRSFAADQRGVSLTDYALTVAFVALGSTGVTSAIGVEVHEFFQRIELLLCIQVQQLCVLH